MTQEEIIRTSAALRGQRDFSGSIDLVGKHLASFDATYIINAYHELFLAAGEAGRKMDAVRFAEVLLILEPGMPSAKAYLAQHGASL